MQNREVCVVEGQGGSNTWMLLKDRPLVHHLENSDVEEQQLAVEKSLFKSSPFLHPPNRSLYQIRMITADSKIFQILCLSWESGR
jgi:hypothetical protein